MRTPIKPIRVGDPVELCTLTAGHNAVWLPVKVVEVDDEMRGGYIVFETASGQRPVYGYGDEGRAWRRGTHVTCPVCKGCGQVLAPSQKA
jgi:hypothetical protein